MSGPRARLAAACLALLAGATGAGGASAGPAATPAVPGADASPASPAQPAAAPADAKPAAQPAAPSAQRVQRLMHMVRQDCGSCHGMRMTGGLGPALTPEALAGKPVESLAATIYHGRPGTPMPGWRSMLTAEEAHWIAQQLLDGLPDAAR